MKIAIPDLISNSYFPALAAVELGCFAEEGLDVEVELIFPPNKANAALREGAVDMVAASAHSTLAAYPGWEGARIIGAQSRGMYWFLVLHSDFKAARGDIAALRGRSIGAAPWVEMGLRGVLAAAGLDPERDGIEIGPPPKYPEIGPNFGLSAFRALEDRKIDGFWANGMAAELALRSGVGSLVLDARRDPWPAGIAGFTFASIVTSAAKLAERPDLASGALRALKKAQALLREDASRAAEVGRKLFPPEEAGLIATLIERDSPWYDAAVTRADYDDMNAFARSLGVLDRPPAPFEEVVTPQ